MAWTAEAIAVGWWWSVRGNLALERLVLLVQGLLRRCLAIPGHHALGWDCLNRVAPPREAERASQWVEALDRAQQALRLHA